MHTTEEYSITCVFVENEINKYQNEGGKCVLWAT